MRSTRPLRPVHPARRRALASTTVAVGVVIGIITMTGLSAAAASANAGSSMAGSLAAMLPTAPPSAAETARAQSVGDITAEAKATLDEARAALAAAASVSADISASGLDIGVANTTVDTAALREQIDRLSPLHVMPLLFLSGVANDAADETRRVVLRTAALRERLDRAVAVKAAEEAAAAAQKAAEEAAAQAQREAEAAAAAAAAANTPEGAKATARQIASAEYGWGSDQFSCLDSLWNRESTWNYQAANPSSGAFGIPQSLPGSKMASVGADWQTNATTQIRWGLQYIAGSYGSPCGAWSHSQSHGWY